MARMTDRAIVEWQGMEEVKRWQKIKAALERVYGVRCINLGMKDILLTWYDRIGSK